MDAEEAYTLSPVPLLQNCPTLPTQYNYQAALDAALEGCNYTEIAKAMGCHRRTLVKLRHEYVPLSEALSRARAYSLDLKADELSTLCQDHPELHDKPQILKTMFDQGKWFLACADPRKYGDRMNIEVTERIDLKGAMDKAKDRVITVLASQPQAEVLEQKTSRNSSEAIDT